MSARRLLAFLLIGVAVLTAGCPKKNKPQPGDTIYGGGTGARADWADRPVGADPSAAMLGLEGQDTSAFASGNQVRGVLSPVYFDFDQSFVRPSERPKLEAAAAHLKANPTDKLLIEGYCDWRGTTEYNMALGERRAQSVKEFLAGLGVSVDIVETLSKGDMDAAEGADESVMSQDRRAELVIVRP